MNEELYHYGVLGMKWGIRKARKNGTSYKYQSWEQKKVRRMLKDSKEKGRSKAWRKDTQNMLSTYQERDKARVKYAQSTSTGAAIARSIFMTPLGASSYSKLRAADVSRGKAAAAGVLSLAVPFVYSGIEAREYGAAEKRRKSTE